MKSTSSRFRSPPSAAESLIGFVDNALRTLSPKANLAARPSPAAAVQAGPAAAEDAQLSQPAIKRSAALMRVNHSGEVAAQGLYQGQQLTAKSARVKEAMIESAKEEVDHLVWCEQRLEELGGRTSLLNPLWYAGSFVLGAVAGLASDKVSLGFVSETEKQVEGHLKHHLETLPPEDARSRRIVKQMMIDEAEHGRHARSLGGTDLPQPVQNIMKVVAKIMTSTSHHI